MIDWILSIVLPGLYVSAAWCFNKFWDIREWFRTKLGTKKK